MIQDQDDTVPFYFSHQPRFADRLSLAAVPSSVGLARDFTRLALAKWPARPMEDDALLVVSELVTNAVLATPDALALVTVRLLGLRTGLVVEVGDGSPKEPVPAAPDADSEGGRGLLLVRELAARWGSCALPDGKVVWAEIAGQGSLAPSAALSLPSSSHPAYLGAPNLMRRQG
ncbi:MULTISPECIES: ATP-binding protein [unclassified Streptomyces]|uniref:ATP-binding protein n=1 Tax=unclassified Streptomyces TaxID=2593676 RepID=UPI000DD8A865|nr:MULTISPECIES: ATP-binding protein [unclassified Streptomyces]